MYVCMKYLPNLSPLNNRSAGSITCLFTSPCLQLTSRELSCFHSLFQFSFRSFQKHKQGRRATKKSIFFFLQPCPLALAVNKSPAVFIFYPARSTDFEEKIEGLFKTGYCFPCKVWKFYEFLARTRELFELYPRLRIFWIHTCSAILNTPRGNAEQQDPEKEIMTTGNLFMRLILRSMFWSRACRGTCARWSSFRRILKRAKQANY